jgi:GNAT superfamily N-acetyltransferase
MAINYRPFYPEDTAELIRVLMSVRPTIFRVQKKAVYRALIQEVLKAENVYGLVAEEEGKLVGFITAATNWRNFKRGFAFAHPYIIILILFRILRSLFRGWFKNEIPRSHGLDAAAPIKNPAIIECLPADYNSGERSDDVAHIIQSGVDSSHRGKGLGTGLHAAMQKYLSAQGISRIECQIDEGNIGSVIMHERTGWTMVKIPTGYFGYVFIGKGKDAQHAFGKD